MNNDSTKKFALGGIVRDLRGFRFHEANRRKR
jgi:hypothetical protein